MTLNAKARVSLMKRLQRDEPVPPKPAAPVPTPCVMLSNMFDPAEETNPNFHLEIQEDVQGECARFGQVMHIFVDPHSKVRSRAVVGVCLCVCMHKAPTHSSLHRASSTLSLPPQRPQPQHLTL